MNTNEACQVPQQNLEQTGQIIRAQRFEHDHLQIVDITRKLEKIQDAIIKLREDLVNISREAMCQTCMDTSSGFSFLSDVMSANFLGRACEIKEMLAEIQSGHYSEELVAVERLEREIQTIYPDIKRTVELTRITQLDKFSEAGDEKSTEQQTISVDIQTQFQDIEPSTKQVDFQVKKNAVQAISGRGRENELRQMNAATEKIMKVDGVLIKTTDNVFEEDFQGPKQRTVSTKRTLKRNEEINGEHPVIKVLFNKRTTKTIDNETQNVVEYVSDSDSQSDLDLHVNKFPINPPPTAMHSFITIQPSMVRNFKIDDHEHKIFHERVHSSHRAVAGSSYMHMPYSASNIDQLHPDQMPKKIDSQHGVQQKSKYSPPLFKGYSPAEDDQKYLEKSSKHFGPNSTTEHIPSVSTTKKNRSILPSLKLGSNYQVNQKYNPSVSTYKTNTSVCCTESSSQGGAPERHIFVTNLAQIPSDVSVTATKAHHTVQHSMEFGPENNMTTLKSSRSMDRSLKFNLQDQIKLQSNHLIATFSVHPSVENAPRPSFHLSMAPHGTTDASYDTDNYCYDDKENRTVYRNPTQPSANTLDGVTLKLSEALSHFAANESTVDSSDQQLSTVMPKLSVNSTKKSMLAIQKNPSLIAVKSLAAPFLTLKKNADYHFRKICKCNRSQEKAEYGLDQKCVLSVDSVKKASHDSDFSEIPSKLIQIHDLNDKNNAEIIRHDQSETNLVNQRSVAGRSEKYKSENASVHHSITGGSTTQEEIKNTKVTVPRKMPSKVAFQLSLGSIASSEKQHDKNAYLKSLTATQFQHPLSNKPPSSHILKKVASEEVFMVHTSPGNKANEAPTANVFLNSESKQRYPLKSTPAIDLRQRSGETIKSTRSQVSYKSAKNLPFIVLCLSKKIAPYFEILTNYSNEHLRWSEKECQERLAKQRDKKDAQASSVSGNRQAEITNQKAYVFESDMRLNVEGQFADESALQSKQTKSAPKGHTANAKSDRPMLSTKEQNKQQSVQSSLLIDNMFDENAQRNKTVIKSSQENEYVNKPAQMAQQQSIQSNFLIDGFISDEKTGAHNQETNSTTKLPQQKQASKVKASPAQQDSLESRENNTAQESIQLSLLIEGLFEDGTEKSVHKNKPKVPTRSSLQSPAYQSKPSPETKQQSIQSSLLIDGIFEDNGMESEASYDKSKATTKSLDQEKAASKTKLVPSEQRSAESQKPKVQEQSKQPSLLIDGLHVDKDTSETQSVKLKATTKPPHEQASKSQSSQLMQNSKINRKENINQQSIQSSLLDGPLQDGSATSETQNIRSNTTTDSFLQAHVSVAKSTFTNNEQKESGQPRIRQTSIQSSLQINDLLNDSPDTKPLEPIAESQSRDQTKGVVKSTSANNKALQIIKLSSLSSSIDLKDIFKDNSRASSTSVNDVKKDNQFSPDKHVSVNILPNDPPEEALESNASQRHAAGGQSKMTSKNTASRGESDHQKPASILKPTQTTNATSNLKHKPKMKTELSNLELYRSKRFINTSVTESSDDMTDCQCQIEKLRCYNIRSRVIHLTDSEIDTLCAKKAENNQILTPLEAKLN